MVINVHCDGHRTVPDCNSDHHNEPQINSDIDQIVVLARTKTTSLVQTEGRGDLTQLWDTIKIMTENW